MKEHSNRYRAQFSRIRQIKELVADPINKSKLLRIDWPENAELYQTRQKKSVYYTQISSSINTGVLYSPDGVLSLSTISDIGNIVLFIFTKSVPNSFICTLFFIYRIYILDIYLYSFDTHKFMTELAA